MYCPLCRTTVTENMGHSCVKVAPVPDWSKMFPNLNEKYSDLLQSHSSLCGEIEQKSAYIRELTDALEGTRKERGAALLQNGVLLTYIERVRKNVSSDNICDCHGRIGEPHKKDCLLIALYALDGCICVKFGGFGGIHLDDCPGKKVESLGAGLTDESQREANKLKAEVDRWVERSRVAEDKGHESNRLNGLWQKYVALLGDEGGCANRVRPWLALDAPRRGQEAPGEAWPGRVLERVGKAGP